MSRNVCSAALLFTLCLIPAHRFVSAQRQIEQTAARNAQSELQSTNCENYIAALEAANHNAGKEGLIIMIARLGDSEGRQDLNRRRLHNARVYLTEYLRLRAPKTIVTAEGERVNGHGRIELYVGGKLYDVIALRHNEVGRQKWTP